MGPGRELRKARSVVVRLPSPRSLRLHTENFSSENAANVAQESVCLPRVREFEPLVGREMHDSH